MYCMSPPASAIEKRLAVFDANVAGKPRMVVDVAMVHEFHGASDDIGRHGAPRHTQNLDRVLIDAAKHKVSKVPPRLSATGQGFLAILSTSGPRRSLDPRPVIMTQGHVSRVCLAKK